MTTLSYCIPFPIMHLHGIPYFTRQFKKIAIDFQTDAAVGYRLQDDLEIQDSVTAEEGGEPDGAVSPAAERLTGREFDGEEIPVAYIAVFRHLGDCLFYRIKIRLTGKQRLLSPLQFEERIPKFGQRDCRMAEEGGMVDA